MHWDSSMCRICLESGSDIIDFSVKIESKKDSTYLDLFNSCTGLEARFDDYMPQIICNQCSNNLLKFYEFLNRAITSDRILKNTLDAENKMQYFTGSDDDKETVQEVELQESSPIEYDTITYYEEALESQEQGDENPESVSENVFEIVHCGSLIYEDAETEDYEEKYEEIVETKPKNEYGSYDDNLVAESKSPTECNKTIDCNICGKVLKRWSLKHHMTRCHKKEKLYLCSACPKIFTIPSDLKIHMKIHDETRERSFFCTICRKGFFEKQALGVHMLRHTGIKEYQCEICQKQFTTKKSLEVHEFTHNRQSGRFVCKYCTKRFPSKADLTVHERFHTGDYPYKCEFCEKSYAVKSHYNYHIAKHKGVTYKCDQCDKEFMNRGSLTAHKFKHRDRMPHECTICKKGFPSPFKLNRHQNCHKAKEIDVSNE